MNHETQLKIEHFLKNQSLYLTRQKLSPPASGEV